MQTLNIDRRLNVIEQALEWEANVPESEKSSYREKLINIRRELKKIKFAISERPSAAAFGESQMGKSYLVSAMLSTPEHPFSVTDGKQSYNFIDEVNPSSPNSTIEATGVVTRFTTNVDPSVPTGILKSQLLTVADIVLVLCESFYNQVDYSYESVLDKDMINSELAHMPLSQNHEKHSFIDVDDIMEIEEYLQSNTIQKKVVHLLGSNIFKYLLMNLSRLSQDRIFTIFKLMWNNNSDINRLFDDLMNVYRQFNFNRVVYTPFVSVLKKHGTLLDVARLDEMYGEPEAVGTEYIANANVYLSPSGAPISVKKSFFSALIAELCFSLSPELANSRGFLGQLDILDFPGARRPEQIKETRLAESKNLSTVLRRGKVTYLFNKYSKAKRISTLLFCHNNNQSAESTMGNVLTEWIANSIGKNEISRGQFIQQSKLSPLFIIATWFNKDLEYQNESIGDTNRLNERWQRRFKVVLEKEVLKSLDDDEHWFNRWTQAEPAFQNIYMLRDFKYSKSIYTGYDPDNNMPELSLTPIEKYPSFMRDLRQSFVTNPFVVKHFPNPSLSWDEAAEVACDGTRHIIHNLNEIAPYINNAREEQFNSLFRELHKEIKTIIEQYYHSESADEQIKKAKRSAGRACRKIDEIEDPYFFGRLMDSMMISESSIYELVHQQILGSSQTQAVTGPEARMFMMAGLSTSVSRDENIDRLCDYLGVDDEDECREELEDSGIDIDSLLSQCKMMVSEGELMLQQIEELWHDKFLNGKVVEQYKNLFPAINSVISNIWTLYNMLGMHQNLTESISHYLKTYDKDVVVGILADYTAMTLNRFVNTFGFDFMSDDDKQNILSQNRKLGFGIDESIINDPEKAEGIQLLGDLYEMKERMTSGQQNSADREMQMRFPQYRQAATWAQRLRLGYVYACQLPDYDIKANTQLKGILENLNAK